MYHPFLPVILLSLSLYLSIIPCSVSFYHPVLPIFLLSRSPYRPDLPAAGRQVWSLTGRALGPLLVLSPPPPPGPDPPAAICSDLENEISNIFTACSFQDLTGQRINKVVRALGFIEERVESMLSVWHKGDLATMPLPPSIIKDDAGLALTGPAPGDPDHAAHSENISQTENDALFG